MKAESKMPELESSFPNGKQSIAFKYKRERFLFSPSYKFSDVIFKEILPENIELNDTKN